MVLVLARYGQSGRSIIDEFSKIFAQILLEFGSLSCFL